MDGKKEIPHERSRFQVEWHNTTTDGSSLSQVRKQKEEGYMWRWGREGVEMNIPQSSVQHAKFPLNGTAWPEAALLIAKALVTLLGERLIGVAYQLLGGHLGRSSTTAMPGSQLIWQRGRRSVCCMRLASKILYHSCPYMHAVSMASVYRLIYLIFDSIRFSVWFSWYSTDNFKKLQHQMTPWDARSL